MSVPQNQQNQALVADPANPTNGSSGRDSAASSVLEPKTYIDPAADVVLRSNDGREFRVYSHTLKAHSDKFLQMLANQPSEPIAIDSDRKTVKLFLDLITLVPMPASYVWAMRDRLLPIIEEYESKSALERMLALSVGCPERDPWGMFVFASKHNYIPLARVALFELRKEDDFDTEFGTGNQFDMGMGMGMNNQFANQFGPQRGFGQNQHGFNGFNGFPQHGFHQHGVNQQFQQFSPTASSHDSVLSKRSSKAAPIPPLRNLTPANFEGVSPPFMLGRFNAIMAAATDGVPLTWANVATRFDPMVGGEERPLTKKERKQLGGNVNQFGQYQPMGHMGSSTSVKMHTNNSGGDAQGAGFGRNSSPNQQQQPFHASGNKAMQNKQQMMAGKKGFAAGNMQPTGLVR